MFELKSSQDRAVKVHFTSTGDKVYGPVPDGKGQSANSMHSTYMCNIHNTYLMSYYVTMMYAHFLPRVSQYRATSC